MGNENEQGKRNPLDLFRRIVARKDKGSLAISYNGQHVFCYTHNDTIELLGVDRDVWILDDILVQRGFVTGEQLENAHQIKESDHRNFREVLIDQGFVGDNQIKQAIRIQIYEEIFDVFLEEEVSYKYYDDEDITPQLEEQMKPPFRLELESDHIFNAAETRREEFQRFQENGVSSSMVYEMISEDIPEGDDQVENAIIKNVVAELEEQKCVQNILQDYIYRRFEVFKIVNRLLENDVINTYPADKLLDAARERKQSGQHQQAINLYRQHLKQNPDEPDVIGEYARVLDHENQNEAASRMYLKAAKYHREKENEKKAGELLENACRTDPENEEAQEMYFKVLADLEKDQELRSRGTELIKNLEESGNYKRARRLLSRLIDRFPNDYELHLLGARVAAVNGRHSSADQHLDRAYHIYSPDQDQQGRPVEEKFRDFAEGTGELASRVEKFLEHKQKKENRQTGNRILIACIALLALFAFFIGRYQIQSKNRFSQISNTARNHAHNGQFKKAREKYQEFLNDYPYSYLADDASKRLNDLKTKMDRRRRRKEQKRKKLDREFQKLKAAFKGKGSDLPSYDKLITQLEKLIGRAEKRNYEPVIKKSRTLIQTIEEEQEQAENLIEKADELVEKGKAEEARNILQKVISEYNQAVPPSKIRMPVHVKTIPSGARIRKGDRNIGTAPLYLRVSLNENAEYTVHMDSFETKKISVHPKIDDKITVHLNKQVHWSEDLGSAISTLPAFVDGTIFLITETGKNWTGTPGNRIINTEVIDDLSRIKYGPVSSGNRAYVLSPGGTLYCFEPAAKKTVWTRTLNGDQFFPPSVSKGGNYIFVPAVPDAVYVVNARTGKQTARISLNNHPTTRVINTGNNHYVITADARVEKINPESGTLDKSSRFRIDGSPVGTPAASRGVIWTGLRDGRFIRISPIPKESSTVKKLSSPVRYGPFIKNNRIVLLCRDNTLCVFEKESGDVLLEEQYETQISAPPALTDRYVLISTADKKIQALHPETGDVIWNVKTTGVGRSGFLVEPDFLLSGTDSGFLYFLKR